MPDFSVVNTVHRPSWQSRVVHFLVAARMRPHALKPIDPSWVRRQMGRPRVPRRWMAQSTGAVVRPHPAKGRWPGGEHVHAPGAKDDAPVLLYLHGGGYIAGSPESHRSLVGSLVRRIHGSAFVPAYRLAPEHPYPAALIDARRAYEHLIEDCAIAPHRIVLAGDSAGGGLIMALALSLRDDGMPMPAAIVAFSPWTDLTLTGHSLDENTERCAMFAGDTIRRASVFYIGGSDPAHPYLSPLYGDFSGMPPMLVHASHDEVLRDDAVRVAKRAESAGVPVELRLWPWVPHVFQFFAAVLPEADQSLRDTVRFIEQRTGRAPPYRGGA